MPVTGNIGREEATAQSTLPAVVSTSREPDPSPGSSSRVCAPLWVHETCWHCQGSAASAQLGRAEGSGRIRSPSCTNGLRVQSVLRTISKEDSSYFVFGVAEHLKMVMKSDQHLSTQMEKYVCEINLNKSDRFAFVSFSSTRKETDKLIQKKNHAQLINLV